MMYAVGKMEITKDRKTCFNSVVFPRQTLIESRPKNLIFGL